MQITVPPFEFVPGTIACLHIPQGGFYQDGIIEEQILNRAKSQNKTVAISKPAGWESATKLPLDLTSVNWLSHAANISAAEATKIISGLAEKLSERIAEKLAWNAGTPRCLLGLAATVTHNPEILIYSTQALDQEGIQSVHKFIVTRCRHLCAIHISHPGIDGDGSPHSRNCAIGGRCLDLIFV